MLGQKSHAGSNACLEEMVPDKCTGIWVACLLHYFSTSSLLTHVSTHWNLTCVPTTSGALLKGWVVSWFPNLTDISQALSYLTYLLCTCWCHLCLTCSPALRIWHLPAISQSSQVQHVSNCTLIFPSVMLFLGSLSLLISFSHPSLGIIFMFSVDFWLFIAR